MRNKIIGLILALAFAAAFVMKSSAAVDLVALMDKYQATGNYGSLMLLDDNSIISVDTTTKVWTVIVTSSGSVLVPLAQ